MARNLLRWAGEAWEAEGDKPTQLPGFPGIEARPWRVLVFLGSRSPGLLLAPCGLSARTTVHAIVPDSWPWGNAVS